MTVAFNLSIWQEERGFAPSLTTDVGLFYNEGKTGKKRNLRSIEWINLVKLSFEVLFGIPDVAGILCV